MRHLLMIRMPGTPSVAQLRKAGFTISAAVSSPRKPDETSNMESTVSTSHETDSTLDSNLISDYACNTTTRKKLAHNKGITYIRNNCPHAG